MLNAPNAPPSLKLYLKDCIEFFSYIRNNPNKFTGAKSIQLYHLRGFDNGCQSKKGKWLFIRTTALQSELFFAFSVLEHYLSLPSTSSVSKFSNNSRDDWFGHVDRAL